MVLIGWMRLTSAVRRGVVSLRSAAAGSIVVLCVLAGCGAATEPTSGAQGAPTASAGDGGSGGGGGSGAQPTPARTPLIKTLDMAGSPTFVRASPVPAAANCTITAKVYLAQGAPQSLASNRGPDPKNPGQVTWDISGRIDPSTVSGTKWDVQCSAPDAAQPGGVWVGHGVAALGVFPAGSPPASSSR